MKKLKYISQSYRFTSVIILLFVAVGIILSCGTGNQKVTWIINSTEQISGNSVVISGTPMIVTSEEREVIEFNGLTDGLLIKSNPIDGWNNFMIEVDFKPYPGFLSNSEQRFLHIQDPKNEDRRILIELRLNEKGDWYGDWFIKTENESLTLVDSTKTHPINKWNTISLKYVNGKVTGLINKEFQVQGDIEYLSPGPQAQISIGTRMDQRSWFRGAIKEIRFISLN